MKPSVKALVAVAALAASLAAAPSAAPAASPVVTLRGNAALTKLSPRDGSLARAARFHVDVAFATDTPGADLFTIQQAVVYFPDHAGTNGPLFPSCDAAQIARFHGNVARCPKGSQIGAGTVKASAIQLGITATGRVTVFNSHRGKSLTFNFQTILPARINESLDAPITQLHGSKYGEKLTLVVPHSLQEIISGVWVGVQDFDVTLGGSVRRGSVEYSYLKAPRCPTLPMHGVFDFVDGTTGLTSSVTSDAKVRCAAG